MHPTRLDTSLLLALIVPTIPSSHAIHHMSLAPVHWVNRRDSSVPLTVTNQCNEDIYPGIQTSGGTGPTSSGFLLQPGHTNQQSVSADWQGRVWGRTNCSFSSDGTTSANGSGPACLTGDCGGTVACPGAGQTPASLAEFTLAASSGQTFYDLSLVDGYNIPIGIVYLGSSSDNSSLTDIPPNLTNPICIGSAALLAPQGDTSDATLGSKSTYPLPLDQSVTSSQIASWCPWELQVNPPQAPGDGVYPYPDDNIQRPLFNPCFSACAKFDTDQYCCTGSHDSPQSCSPNDYSTAAKAICPDVYSYAFDDQTSTFVIPSGGGFEVVFCPAGRSTTILKTFGAQLTQLAQTGQVTSQILADSMNITYILEKNDASSTVGGSQALLALAVLLAFVCLS